MSKKQKRRVEQNERGYQAKIDRPPGKPPTGGSNVKPPPRFFCDGCKNSCPLTVVELGIGKEQVRQVLIKILNLLSKGTQIEKATQIILREIERFNED